MSILSIFHSASAQFGEKIYSMQVGLSVYVGLVRVSIQERIPFLGKHAALSILFAFVVVLGVQVLILIITLFTKTLSFIWTLPSLFGSVLAYIPIVNKWV